MNTYFLFSDNDIWHAEISASTWSAALRLARKMFGIGGRVRIVSYNYDSRDYRLDGTRYNFSLRRVS